MTFPSLGDPFRQEEPEPLERVAQFVLRKKEGGAGTEGWWRYFTRAWGASFVLHITALSLVIVFSPKGVRPEQTEPEPVPMVLYERPVPIPPPRPFKPAPPTPPATAAPQSVPPSPVPQALPPANRRPIVPPVGPLPQPNRMGPKVPVPPPPKPNKGTPPDAIEPMAGPEGLAKAEKPPQMGLPDGTGREIGEGSPQAEREGEAGREAGPGMEEGGGAEGPPGSMGPRGEQHGTIPVPAPGSGSGQGVPGGGGFGERGTGLGKKPARRGLNYGVPYDTGSYLGFNFEHKDFDWTDYWSVMYWSIWREWHRQLLYNASSFERAAFERGREGLDGTAVLRFTIERNGNVSLVELITPSGIEPLDLSSSQALKAVGGTLPPLPADFPDERERVTGQFIMTIADIRQLRPSLEWQRARGDF